MGFFSLGGIGSQGIILLFNKRKFRNLEQCDCGFKLVWWKESYVPKVARDTLVTRLAGFNFPNSIRSANLPFFICKVYEVYCGSWSKSRNASLCIFVIL